MAKANRHHNNTIVTILHHEPEAGGASTIGHITIPIRDLPGIKAKLKLAWAAFQATQPDSDGEFIEYLWDQYGYGTAAFNATYEVQV